MNNETNVTLPASERLAQLLQTAKEQHAEGLKHEYGSEGYLKSRVDLFKTEEAIKKLKSEIAAEEAIAAQTKLKNDKIALIEAYGNAKVANHGKGKTDETAAAEKTAFDALVNELLSHFSAPKVQKASNGVAKTGGKSSDIKNDILAQFHANKAAGMTDTENKKAIVANGHAVGTVGAVILQWERENGLKPAKA